jgi:DNA helicase-2/ATP-dependent DNA helicase PcrA
MTTAEHDLELEDERTSERRYAEQLRKKEATRPRPHSWTGRKVPLPPDLPIGEFVGRVALHNPDELLGQRKDFYIGEKHATVDGVEVFSWTAPIACSYFRRNHQHDSYQDLGQLCADVAVIRSFRHEGGQITEFADDRLTDPVPERPFPKRGLSIPAGPSRPLPRPRPAPTTETPDRPRPPSDARDVSADAPIDSGQPKPAHGTVDGGAIRAESLLRAQLHAPRTAGLAPVLSTLQPEQYELVTIPAMDSVVIEGQPGTGKTIIASHRAAYLVNDKTPPENSLDGKVLVVGPTPGYSRHIREVIQRLGDGQGRIIVLSMQELMQHILGARSQPQGPVSTSWHDVDWTLGRLARLAIQRHRELTGALPTREQAYGYLRANAAAGRPLTQNPEWVHYLPTLPPFDLALTRRSQAPLLAYITCEVARPDDLKGIEHIIVDEAQDVTELEWWLLSAINEARAWTILGDLNQRRSDHTHSSWDKVLDVLDLDVETPVRRIKRGYRSTKPILDYANKLLPRDQRSIDAFQQHGPAPTIVPARAKVLGEAVFSEIDRLTGIYKDGTVAVITVQPDVITRPLRRRGWAAADYSLRTWRHAEAEVIVHEPDSARGLEFDAVIVVEPNDFPMNYGRRGPLYTALTRPNRELSIVHAKSLPDALKRKSPVK